MDNTPKTPHDSIWDALIYLLAGERIKLESLLNDLVIDSDSPQQLLAQWLEGINQEVTRIDNGVDEMRRAMEYMEDLLVDIFQLVRQAQRHVELTDTDTTLENYIEEMKNV